MMEWVEFTAKTVSDAVTEASIKFEVTSDMLEYEVIEVEKSGFLGLFSKPAKIKARKKAEEVKKAEPVVKKEEKKVPVKKEVKAASETKVVVESKKVQPEAAEEKPVKEVVKKEVNVAEVEAAAKKFLVDVFHTMDIEANILAHYNNEEGLLEVNIEGDDMGVLIGKRGQTLDSLQYLVSLVVNKESNSYLKVKLDTENYRERRKETLENLARNIAYKVKRTRKTVSLEPMNPYERRVIHSALQNDRYVTTHSEGEEPYRRVVVTLKDNHHRNYRKKGER